MFDKTPILLNEAEAMQHAASALRMMADQYEAAEDIQQIGMDAVVAIDGDKGEEMPVEGDLKKRIEATLDSFKTRVPYPAIQAKACRDAADKIGKMALDARIAANVDVPR